MPKIKIIKPGLLTSIQDQGRIGYAYYAIPKSGYIQSSKAQSANLLVGNDLNGAVIECILVPPTIEFLDDNCIAITGDDFNFSLNENKVKYNKTIHVKKGDILKGATRKNTTVAYIAFQGRMKAQLHYGSQSTYSNAFLGGLNGNLLKKEDLIEIINSTPQNLKRKIVESSHDPKSNEIIFYKGPEFDLLDKHSQISLFSTKYQISPSTNRMGARLIGQRISTTVKQLEYSVPVLPGFIQLPQSGQPIVILNDGQTTGGYPRIGYVQNSDIEKFVSIGRHINFKLSK